MHITAASESHFVNQHNIRCALMFGKARACIRHNAGDQQNYHSVSPCEDILWSVWFEGGPWIAWHDVCTNPRRRRL